MSHFKAKMHQILFPASVRSSIRRSCQTCVRPSVVRVKLASVHASLVSVVVLLYLCLFLHTLFLFSSVVNFCAFHNTS